MLNGGRWAAAKKVTMALQSLIQGQFPRDRLFVVGFSDHAEEVSPDAFAALVGGWDVVRRDWWGGFASEGSLEADAEFMRNDPYMDWYRSHYPDGTPIVFHTASGIEHVYELR